MDVWEGKHIVWIQLLQTFQLAATSGNKWNHFIFYLRFDESQILYCYIILNITSGYLPMDYFKPDLSVETEARKNLWKVKWTNRDKGLWIFEYN